MQSENSCGYRQDQKPSVEASKSVPKFYAHSLAEQPPSDWEPVEAHLRLVSVGDGHSQFRGAHGFAEVFSANDWGELAGWWHDLGKYSREFQDYLREANGLERESATCETLPGRVDHSTFGARHAASCGMQGKLLAYVIAGHHGGLPDYAKLQDRLTAKAIPEVEAPAELLDLELPAMPALTPGASKAECAFQIAFFTRMVFSALVDADFLATESFMAPDRWQQRLSEAPPTLSVLKDALDPFLENLASKADPQLLVNRERAEVLEACRAQAGDQPGFFSLTVPTGGGKTLSSLAFALGHAVRHNLQRVIYAIPLTSIIEQNAAVFREALARAGSLAVLEHHVNFEPSEEDLWSRLASENWDAPLVVTTTVQLYESLFAHKPSRCRKLHNIANSVIILDEAQTIPVHLLAPTLMALRELERNYGCSIVLCSATQPAVNERSDFPIGLPEPREIVPDVGSLFDALKRTRIEPIRRIEDDALAAELAAEPQVLCIVHTKRQAREVFARLCAQVDEPMDVPIDARSCLFLTTDLCPEHRSLVISRIRDRLENKQPCRVVSTNLIEAGVDVDFPVVYRAIAGLDSIAQAAGRCNREGKLDGLGRVVVFEPEAKVPTFVHRAVEDAKVVARRHDDLLSPEAIEDYFAEHYWTQSDRWDCGAKDHTGKRDLSVLACFQVGSDFVFDFRTAAARYRLIEDEQVPILVPWGEGVAVIEQLRALTEPPGRRLQRRCQRFAVGVRQHTLRDMIDRGAVAEVGMMARGMYLLDNAAAYDPVIGLCPAAGLDPNWLIEGG